MAATSWGMIPPSSRGCNKKMGTSCCSSSSSNSTSTIIIFIIFLNVFINLPNNTTAEKSKEYKMINVCKNHFLQQLYRKIDGAVLTSQNERNLDCAITFQTHSILQRFMLRFDRLQLDCNDHLYIYDGAHAVGNYKADLSCRNTKQSVGAIFTRTNFVTLKYVTDGWGTESNGYRLVITAVKDPKHTCKDFKCNSREFCIDTDLVCDGVNHCGDGSDEATSTLCANTEASTILGIERTWFAISIISTLITLAGAVAGMIMCFCKQRNNTTPRHLHNANNNAQTHPPVSYPLQQMYGSNGTAASSVMPLGMTTLKGHQIQGGIMGATTLPRPGNWLRPAGLRLGHSAARVRLYCQAK